MPKRSNPVFRTLLYISYKAENKTVTRPVAVFPNEDKARRFKQELSDRVKSGDLEKVRELDPDHHEHPTTKTHKDARYAFRQMPYDPEISVVTTSDDEFEI